MMRNPLNFARQTIRLQRGAAAVEFALIAGLLFTLMFGITEMGRVLFYINTASEVTSIGARLATVCNQDDSDIKATMRNILPLLGSDADIDIQYLPAGCSASTCTSVRVAIAPGVQINTYIPYVPFTINLPPSPTTLRRESMNSVNNPDCR